VTLAPGGTRYSTPVGEIASVPMRDGSKVTLNTDSQIRVTLTDSERRVDLKYGEAFFEVSKDPKRPFVVNAGGKRVIAVGTQFSVRRDANDIQVVVTEGRFASKTRHPLFALEERGQGVRLPDKTGRLTSCSLRGALHTPVTRAFWCNEKPCPRLNNSSAGASACSCSATKVFRMLSPNSIATTCGRSLSATRL